MTGDQVRNLEVTPLEPGLKIVAAGRARMQERTSAAPPQLTLAATWARRVAEMLYGCAVHAAQEPAEGKEGTRAPWAGVQAAPRDGASASDSNGPHASDSVCCCCNHHHHSPLSIMARWNMPRLRGATRWEEVEPPPALSPKIVIRLGLPPAPPGTTTHNSALQPRVNVWQQWSDGCCD